MEALYAKEYIFKLMIDFKIELKTFMKDTPCPTSKELNLKLFCPNVGQMPE